MGIIFSPIHITKIGEITLTLGGDKKDNKTRNNFNKTLKTSNDNRNHILHLKHTPHNQLHKWCSCLILCKQLHHNRHRNQDYNQHNTNLCIRGMRFMSYLLKSQIWNKHMGDLSNQIHALNNKLGR